MKYFLDANVLMHFANDERKSNRILKHINRVGAENIFISAVTLYEINTKLIKSKVSRANIERLDAIAESFTVRNFNTAAALSAAKVRAQLESTGDGIGHPDQMLAGQVKAEKAVLVTNNTKHFARVHGIKLEDWTD